MCGINGFILQNPQIVDPGIIRAMNRSLLHRGPDEEGIYEKRNVTLGMRRLKIIDMATGQQPIYNEDRSIVTVFNGEIYNYKELRKDLEAKGHRFITQSDTEVIVHQYEEVGDRCVEYFRGMFAFAIWDDKKRRLIIARDRLGIKQIYYYHDDNKFIFSSEIKGIFNFPNIEKKMDPTSLSDYFSFLYVPSPKTIYSNILQIPAGHLLIYSNGNIELRKYWDVEYREEKVRKEEEYIEELLDLLKEAVRLRLISDVPLGAFLSGGVDSGIIVALMSQMMGLPAETFSIGYPAGSETYDERKYAKAVSEQYNTHHHEFVVKHDIADVTEKIIPYFDQPFADASAIPNYYLCKETKNYVTVALSGLGGDELAGGYERYLGYIIGDHYQALPDGLIKGIIPSIIRRVPDSRKGNHFIRRLKKFVEVEYLGEEDRYFNLIAKYGELEKRNLFLPDILETIGSYKSCKVFSNYLENTENMNPLDKVLYLDLKTYLVDDLLVLTDRMSMAHSLEARVPFLDHKLVEFFATLPPSIKIRGWKKKYILKKVAERYLPKDTIYHPKMGFSVPLVLWFRENLQEYVREVLSDSMLSEIGMFNKQYINSIVERHLSAADNYDEKIWSIIVFVLWYKKTFLRH